MRFNKMFQRRKGGVAPPPLIGTDGTAGNTNPPTEPPNNQRDNILSIKPYSNSGWPAHRIAISYSSDGAAGTDLPCEVWGFDHLTSKWFLMDVSKNLILNRVTYFDVASFVDQAPTTNNLDAPSSGALEIFVKIQDNVTPNGIYTFGIGADLTPLAV